MGSCHTKISKSDHRRHQLKNYANILLQNNIYHCLKPAAYNSCCPDYKKYIQALIPLVIFIDKAYSQHSISIKLHSPERWLGDSQWELSLWTACVCFPRCSYWRFCLHVLEAPISWWPSQPPAKETMVEWYTIHPGFHLLVWEPAKKELHGKFVVWLWKIPWI